LDEAMSTPTPQPQQPLGGGLSESPLGGPLVPETLARDHGGLSDGGGVGPIEPVPEPPRARVVGRTALVGWPWWTAFAALFAGFVFAFFGAIVVDVPAAILGVHLESSNLPPGIELGDTAVQDIAFVCAAVLFAHVGVRTVRAWQFGLRKPRVPWRRVALAIPLTYVAFFTFDVIWAELLNVNEKEKLLETLGANEGVALLILSAGLTCVMAPVCEELLFRGFIFRALGNWRGWFPAAILTGLIFGAVHVGSAPAVDLPPLAFLGFLLCVLYRTTGSLYPCIGVHALNNCIAFASLEGWSFGQGVLLVAIVMSTLVALVLVLTRLHVIGDDPTSVPTLEPVLAGGAPAGRPPGGMPPTIAT
jgi:CAAX protease family protein